VSTPTAIERLYVELPSAERRVWLIERGWRPVDLSRSSGWTKRGVAVPMSEAIAHELGEVTH
jgi:hypothetical protein